MLHTKKVVVKLMPNLERNSSKQTTLKLKSTIKILSYSKLIDTFKLLTNFMFMEFTKILKFYV